MTDQAAARLARGLLAMHEGESHFDFEVGSAENADLVTHHLEQIGCKVERLHHSARIHVERSEWVTGT